jgi:uncharacterized protein (TIGR03067 family)
MLAKRLSRHGLPVSGGTLAAVLSDKAALATVPGSVMNSTIKALTLVAAEQATAAALVSARAAALTEGVIKGMLLTRLKIGAALILVITGLAVGHAVLRAQAARQPQHPAANDKPQPSKTDDAGRQKRPRDDMDRLQGTWRLVSSQSDGLTFDEDRPEIKDTRLVIANSSVTMIGQVIHDPRIKKEPEDAKAAGTFTLDTGKRPKQIVFAWESNPLLSKEYLTQRGIYALDGNTLKLCFYFPGSDTKPLVPTEFSANTGSKRNLGTWKRVPQSGKGEEIESRRATRLPPDLGKIQPPGGVPLVPGRSGTPLTVEMMMKVRKRLESAPAEDLDKWVGELERIMGERLEEELARQACRTYFVTRMSVAFDGLKWNARAADKLFKRAQTMPASEAKIWKGAFQALLKKEIGQTATEVMDGGPGYAVPLVLVPVDALHEGQKYSAEQGRKYLARLKQLTREDISLWRARVDKFWSTELDAAITIVLLDDYFDKENFQRGKFKAAVEEEQEKKNVPAEDTEQSDKLQGAWQLAYLKSDGLTVGEGRPELKDTRLLITQNSFRLFGTPEAMLSESAARDAVADFTFDSTHTPTAIVLTWKECPWNGKKDFVRKAIFAVDNDSLKLCLSRKDDDKEAPSDFSARAGSERLLWVFRRAQ